MEPVIRLHPADDVVISRQQMLSGATIEGGKITVRGLVPPGHKIATRRVAKGEPVRRYNQIIGFATADIEPGAHVHVHNRGMGADGGAFGHVERGRDRAQV